MAPLNEKNNSAFYLVCLTESQPNVRSLELEGIEPDSMVHLLELNDITALYCVVDPAVFTGSQGEKNMENLDWIVPRITRHQTITEAVHGISAVLPVRFGSIFSGKQQLTLYVQRNMATIRVALKNLTNTEEWGIKIYFKRQQLMATRLAGLHENENLTIASVPPGKRYFIEKQLEKTAAQQTTEQLQEHLRGIAKNYETFVEAAEALGSGGEEQVNGLELVANQALLVNRDNRQGVLRKTEEINSVLERDGFSIALSGPWPPYNFCPELVSAVTL